MKTRRAVVDFLKPTVFLLFGILLLGPNLCSGQDDAPSTHFRTSDPEVKIIPLPVGADTKLWKFTPIADHHDSIVQIVSGDGVGTGVVVSVDKEKRIKNGHQGFCVTAWHVVSNDQDKGEIGVLFRDGSKAKDCQVVAHDEDADLAIVWVWIPDGIEPAMLAEEEISGGDNLEFAGLGGGSELTHCLRHFSATASLPSSEEKIFADVPLLPGDSGGPVFNSNNHLVGVISGGWFWWDGGVTNEQGNTISATWPARAANLGPIQTLMAKAESADLTPEVVNR